MYIIDTSCSEPTYRGDGHYGLKLQYYLFFQHFTEGITNKLVGCYEADKGFPSKDVVLIRIHGANTDLIIDRDTEKNNILLMSEHGLCPPLYGVFKNGIVYGFCPGETLDCDTVKQYRV